jgi:hypothetical protein
MFTDTEKVTKMMFLPMFHAIMVLFPDNFVYFCLQLAFQDDDLEAVYLLTDGKPDTSTSLVLREVARMNLERNVSVNTISFNCSDR